MSKQPTRWVAKNSPDAWQTDDPLDVFDFGMLFERTRQIEYGNIENVRRGSIRANGGVTISI